MSLWSKAYGLLDSLGGVEGTTPQARFELLQPQYQWAAQTSEMFTGFLSEHVSESELRTDGSRILKTFPQPQDDGGTTADPE